MSTAAQHVLGRVCCGVAGAQSDGRPPGCDMKRGPGWPPTPNLAADHVDDRRIPAAGGHRERVVLAWRRPRRARRTWGAALAEARLRKERVYLELLRPNRCRLAVLALEAVGVRRQHVSSASLLDPVPAELRLPYARSLLQLWSLGGPPLFFSWFRAPPRAAEPTGTTNKGQAKQETQTRKTSWSGSRQQNKMFLCSKALQAIPPPRWARARTLRTPSQLVVTRTVQPPKRKGIAKQIASCAVAHSSAHQRAILRTIALQGVF